MQLLTRLPLAGLGLALAVPLRAARGACVVAGAGLEAAGVAVDAAVKGASALSETAVRVTRVARSTVTPGPGWQAGERAHIALRPAAGVRRSAMEAAAKKVARTLLDHPDVLLAYWDSGLSRLVVEASVDAAIDRVATKAAAVAARHGLLTGGDPVGEELTHPGDATAVRTAAAALALDTLGIAVAVAGRVTRQRRTPEWATAAVTLLREDPRVRATARRRLGRPGADLLLAAANAAVHALGQSPTSLALDAGLRVGQLVEAVARAAAFDAAHDVLCSPDRLSVGAGTAVPRPQRRYPADDYASSAATGSLIGAAATLVFKQDAREAAQAVLAGSPKAARYGPVAYAGGVGSVLTRNGVLVRDVDRLRHLEIVDTVLLHTSALRGTRRVVLEVNANVAGWDCDRLWQAACAALQPPDDAVPPGPPPGLQLRPVPGQESSPTGLMVASSHGRDVGTVLIGWELDPLAEAVLDAARQADLHVAMVDDPAFGDFTALADEVVDAQPPLADFVRDRQAEDHVVLTVARLGGDRSASDGLTEADREVLDGLLRSDLAVSVTDEGSAVVWSADLLALNGLEGVCRLLAAVPGAQAVGRKSKVLAQSGAALSGLLVATRRSKRLTSPLALGIQLGPVNAAAAAALLTGWQASLKLAASGAPQPRSRVAWHALEPDEALARLARAPRLGPTALSTARQSVRDALHSASDMSLFAPLRVSTRLASAVWAELDDPLTPVLAVGAAASAIVGSGVDALLVTGAMGMNAMVGGVQRLRSEHALAALAAGQKQKARLVPDTSPDADADADAVAPGTVDAARLVVGDMIELGTGDVVPADARLIDLDSLEVDESSLTGESLPVSKQLDATPRAAAADRLCMVFEGSTVVSGHARAVVVSTGEQTEAGRAVALASRSTPAAGVQVRLQELTRKALPLTLAGGAAVTALTLLRGHSIRQAISGGVSVAVAAVPEGLPLVATVAQMAAARRLTRRGVLVRTPRTLEALGRVDTVCFDKTGTLTENRLRVARLTSADGVGHEPDSRDGAAVLQLAARACPLADGEHVGHAHATDEAVLAAGDPGADWTQMEGQPFEASRGYAAATGHTADGAHLLVVKGAPEVVLPHCDHLPPNTDRTGQDLAAQGLRVLALARRPLTPGQETNALSQPLDALEFVGFVALADTPRASSAALVAGLREAGVKPVMLTGDHPQTALAVALALGWPKETTVVTGDQLASLDKKGRARLLRDAAVVARVAPEQKLQVVQALRAAGRVVAMVGDGANDAAAIRAADVGIGIATRGSAAARNAADLVLTHDDLAVLVEALAEGRSLWRSVADAISILIGGNAGEVGFTVLGTLLSGTSPLSTRQLLLVNLLTDMFPAMAVAVTPSEEGTREGSEAADGAPAGTAALGSPLTRQIRQRGVITGLGATTAWLIGSLTPGSARRTGTMALCGVVGAQLTQTLAGREHSPLVLATTLGSAAVLVGIVQTPLLSHFFGCTPLGPVAWTGVGAAIAVAAVSPWALDTAGRLLPDALARLRSDFRTAT
ncbi:cation-translocating P-type ATPase [Kitasatospora aureofaciens]|uniref:cation-translocating P-type ATPase n=1 Tax=Kitasatospora aureofaciens TaxID=1894 RepID=UPI0033C5AC70